MILLCTVVTMAETLFLNICYTKIESYSSIFLVLSSVLPEMTVRNGISITVMDP